MVVSTEPKRLTVLLEMQESGDWRATVPEMGSSYAWDGPDVAYLEWQVTNSLPPKDYRLEFRLV